MLLSSTPAFCGMFLSIYEDLSEAERISITKFLESSGVTVNSFGYDTQKSCLHVSSLRDRYICPRSTKYIDINDDVIAKINETGKAIATRNIIIILGKENETYDVFNTHPVASEAELENAEQKALQDNETIEVRIRRHEEGKGWFSTIILSKRINL